MSDHSHDPHAHAAHSHDGDHASHDDHESHGGLGQYIAVFVALCVLTGASFFTYSSLWPFHKTPAVGWAFMMAVSCTKALLVILFFMHLLWEANWKYVLTFPAMFMSIFLGLMLVPDVGWRLYHVSEDRRMFMAVPTGEEKILVHEEQEHAAHSGHDHNGDHKDAHGDAPADAHGEKPASDAAGHTDAGSSEPHADAEK